MDYCQFTDANKLTCRLWLVVYKGFKRLAGRMMECSLSVKVNNNRVREQFWFVLMI